MMSVSATAARARLRRVVHQLTVAERAALAAAAALGLAAVGAIYADAGGHAWPATATALIAAGLGASLLAAGIGWAIVGSATAIARRIDVAAIRGDRALDEAREMRRCLDGVQHAVQLLVQRQREADGGCLDGTVAALSSDLRAILVEMGRMRMTERDWDATLAQLVGLTRRLVEDDRRLWGELETLARAARERDERFAAYANERLEVERRLSDEVGRLREVVSRMQGAISAMSEAHEAALHAVAAKGFEVGYDARGAEEARARVTRLR